MTLLVPLMASATRTRIHCVAAVFGSLWTPVSAPRWMSRLWIGAQLVRKTMLTCRRVHLGNWRVHLKVVSGVRGSFWTEHIRTNLMDLFYVLRYVFMPSLLVHTVVRFLGALSPPLLYIPNFTSCFPQYEQEQLDQNKCNHSIMTREEGPAAGFLRSIVVLEAGKVGQATKLIKSKASHKACYNFNLRLSAKSLHEIWRTKHYHTTNRNSPFGRDVAARREKASTFKS